MKQEAQLYGGKHRVKKKGAQGSLMFWGSRFFYTLLFSVSFLAFATCGCAIASKVSHARDLVQEA